VWGIVWGTKCNYKDVNYNIIFISLILHHKIGGGGRI